jgi:hypothetical protein
MVCCRNINSRAWNNIAFQAPVAKGWRADCSFVTERDNPLVLLAEAVVLPQSTKISPSEWHISRSSIYHDRYFSTERNCTNRLGTALHLRSRNRGHQEVAMAKEAKGWEALCIAAATEKDPEKLQAIIVELNVLLESRQAELEESRRAGLSQRSSKPGQWTH